MGNIYKNAFIVTAIFQYLAKVSHLVVMSLMLRAFSNGSKMCLSVIQKPNRVLNLKYELM